MHRVLEFRNIRCEVVVMTDFLDLFIGLLIGTFFGVCITIAFGDEI